MLRKLSILSAVSFTWSLAYAEGEVAVETGHEYTSPRVPTLTLRANSLKRLPLIERDLRDQFSSLLKERTTPQRNGLLKFDNGNLVLNSVNVRGVSSPYRVTHMMTSEVTTLTGKNDFSVSSLKPSSYVHVPLKLSSFDAKKFLQQWQSGFLKLQTGVDFSFMEVQSVQPARVCLGKGSNRETSTNSTDKRHYMVFSFRDYSSGRTHVLEDKVSVRLPDPFNPSGFLATHSDGTFTCSSHAVVLVLDPITESRDSLRQDVSQESVPVSDTPSSIPSIVSTGSGILEESPQLDQSVDITEVPVVPKIVPETTKVEEKDSKPLTLPEHVIPKSRYGIVAAEVWKHFKGIPFELIENKKQKAVGELSALLVIKPEEARVWIENVVDERLPKGSPTKPSSISWELWKTTEYIRLAAKVILLAGGKSSAIRSIEVIFNVPSNEATRVYSGIMEDMTLLSQD